MSEEVCRTCFTVLKANKYHAFTDKSNIPGYVTVEDALKTIVPNLVSGKSAELLFLCSIKYSICRIMKSSHTQFYVLAVLWFFRLRLSFAICV